MRFIPSTTPKYAPRRKPTVYFPVRSAMSNVANLAAGAQGTAFTGEIENAMSGVALPPGTVVGLRLWARLYMAAAINLPPRICALIVPAGMAVPTVITAANLKANEKYLWFVAQMRHSYDAQHAFVDVEIGSSRRFDAGDQLVFVVVNDDGATAFAAGATGHILVDCYVANT